MPTASLVENKMRTAEERYFDAADGEKLFYRYWAATDRQPSAKAATAVVLLHRGHEHSGRIMHLVDELNLPDYAMFGWDARGHGRSRDADVGNPTLSTFVNDLDHFVRHITSVHGIAVENIAVIAQSVGGVLAATWVHDYAPKIRCLILATPAFKVKLYVPLARTGLKLASHFNDKLHVNSYVRASALTHDPERIASYQSDPLIQRPISVKVLLGLYSTADRIIDDAGAIQTPTQMLISGKDWVVYQKPQHRFFERLGSTVKERHVFDGFYHDTLGEKDRHLRRPYRRLSFCSACSPNRRYGRRCSMPINAALRGTNSTGSASHCLRCRRKPSPSRSRVFRWGRQVVSRMVSAWDLKRGSIPAARSTTCTATARRESHLSAS